MTIVWPLALASVRLWALLRVQASWRALLGPSWEPIAAALALSLAGVWSLGAGLPIAPPESIAEAAILLALEFLLGSVIGMIAALPGWALCGAATLAELELVGSDRPRSLTSLTLALALAAALALGLHRPLLATLLASFTSLPLAEPLAWSTAVEPALADLPLTLARVTTLALALATPLLLVRLVVEVGVAALGRGSDPAAALLAGVTPGLRFCAAALALAASWSAHPQAWAQGLG
ncbi:flagellar biosynthetic protein FliR [Nannocystaceae bacterium ST9]